MMKVKRRIPFYSEVCSGIAVATLVSCGGSSGGGTTDPASPGFSLDESTFVARPDRAVSADGQLRVELTVTLRNRAGAPVADREVEFRVAGGSARVEQPSRPTNASGVATGRIGSTTAGARTITAVVSSPVGPVELPAPAAITFASPTSPRLTGPALYRDENLDARIDAGDTIAVRFDRAVVLTSSDPAALRLPVQGDHLGAGAALAAGADDHEITIMLGDQPSLRLRRTFGATVTAPGSPSGIDLADESAIVNPTTRAPAASLGPLDLIPGLVRYGDPVALGLLATGDVDNDCDVDLVGHTGVYLNDGSRGFEAGDPHSPVGSYRLALADLDGDGNLDLIGDRGGLRILFGDGQGRFDDPSDLAGKDVRDFVVTDLNGDGAPDLVAGNDPGCMVWLNDGTGGFDVASRRHVVHPDRSAWVESLDVGDLDGDGDVDIAAGLHGAGGDAEPVEIWSNDGSANFTRTTTLDETNAHVVIADADGDGDLDVFANDTTWLNDGAGRFTRGPRIGSNDGVISKVRRTGDVDGDGIIDLLYTAPGDGRAIQVLELGGSGVRLSNVSAPAIGGLVGELVDLDGDGDLDLIRHTPQGLSVELLWNSLAADFERSRFAEIAQIGNQDTYALAIGDVDGDGRLDIVAANHDDGDHVHGTRIWLAGETGSYTDSGARLFSAGSFDPMRGCALGDVDGDGDLDLLLAYEGEDDLLWHNDGQGTFHSPQSVLPGSSTQSVAIADLNGDGRNDLVLGQGFGDPGVVLVQDPGGYRRIEFNHVQPAVLSDLAVGDVDGDGDLDIVIATDGRHRVWLNQLDVTGEFVEGGPFGDDATRTAAIVLADLDGDGDLDAFAANPFAKSRGFENDGTGRFVRSVAVDTRDANVTSAALGDLDGDGLADIVLGTQGPDRVYLNRLRDGYLREVQRFDDLVTRAVAIADVDRDGRAEILAGISHAAVGAPIRLYGEGREPLAYLSYERDVHPLWARNNCTSCHGPQRAPNLAQTPVNALRDVLEHVDRATPEQSRILTRHLGNYPLMTPGTADHGLVLGWIREGAKNN